MKFSELIAQRYSVRNYQPKPVEESLLMQVLEAGRLAPSACNLQPYYFIVIRDDVHKQLLRPAYNRDWFINAPVIIAVCIDSLSEWQRSDGVRYGKVDAAIAMDHMTLAATELGLGTCWIGAFKEDEAKSALNLPKNIEVVAFTPLGYPNQSMPPKKRKMLESIVRWEQFSKSGQ